MTRIESRTAVGTVPETSRRRRRNATRAKLHFRPDMERMEVRITPTTVQWSGLGPDGHWSTDANWVGGHAPVPGDSLDFPSGAAQFDTNNDLGVMTSYNSIEIDDPQYIFNGNSVTITNEISTTYSGPSAAQYNLDTVLDAPGSAVEVNAGPGSLLSMTGAISGTGDLAFTNTGSVTLSGVGLNSYVGTMDVQAGTVVLDKTAATAVSGDLVIGDGTRAASVTEAQGSQINGHGNVTVNANGTFDLANHDDTIQALIFNANSGAAVTGAAVTTGTGTLTLGGDVTVNGSAPAASIDGKLDLGSSTRIFDVTHTSPNEADLVVLAAISGASGVGLNETGTGVLLLANTNTYDGPTNIGGGALVVNGSIASSSLVNVAGSGLLAGISGVVPAVNADGTIFPGDLKFVGTLNSGDLTYSDTGIYLLNINVIGGVTSYNKLDVTGTANLGNALLVFPGVPPGYTTPAPGVPIPLITTTGGFGGSTFRNMPEGGYHSFGPNATFRFTYLANGGNEFAMELVQDTRTTLTSAENPSVFGQPVTFTAEVSGATGPIPTGDVDFYDGPTKLGSAPLVGGVATFNTGAVSAGVRPITAVYVGDSQSAPSTSAVFFQQVNKAASDTVVTASPLPSSVFGQTVTFTATVSAVPPGAGSPAGTVTFFDGTTDLGSAVLSGDTASIEVSSLAVGAHSITARYSGDDSFTTSTSTALSYSVNQDQTAVTVLASANPSVFGQSVTFAALVEAMTPGAGTPSGTVEFFNGATSLGLANVSGGVATLSTSALAFGSNSITAQYSGDTNFLPKTSDVYDQNVQQAVSTTALTSSSNPSVSGESVVFTAVVGAVSPGGGTPTGTVEFFDGAHSLGSRTLTAGVATLSTSTLSVVTHNITAVYSGDTNFAASTSDVLPQEVSKADAEANVGSLVNPSSFGQSVTFIATVAASLPGAGIPTGTVEFFDGATSLGTEDLSGATATFTTADLAVGSHNITIEYSGDANFNAVTSGVLVQVVGAAATTTTLTSSANPSAFGNSVTFTAHVVTVLPGEGTPTGSVVFKSDGTTIGTGTLDASGNATVSTSTLAVGAHTITASYAGATNFAASDATPVTQTVRELPPNDFDGDGIVDPAVLEPSTSTFYILGSKSGVQVIQFGQGTLFGGNPINVSAAYNAGGITEPAVFQASTSTFYIHSASGNRAVQIGIGTNAGGHPIPVPGDYEGDGIIDPAVYEPSTSTWYIARHNGSPLTVQFGQGTNFGGHPTPVPAKYEGSGPTDIAVFESSTSTFFIQRHSAPNIAVQIGIGTSAGGHPKPVQANYEGDGKIDPAVFEPSTSTWYIARHSAPNLTVQFGQGTNSGGNPVPAQADYEGDGKTDIAVFQPSTSTFAIQKHAAPNALVQIGIGTNSGGKPIVSSADFQGDGSVDPATFEPSIAMYFIAEDNGFNNHVAVGLGTIDGGNPIPISSPLDPRTVTDSVSIASDRVVGNSVPPAASSVFSAAPSAPTTVPVVPNASGARRFAARLRRHPHAVRTFVPNAAGTHGHIPLHSFVNRPVRRLLSVARNAQ